MAGKKKAGYAEAVATAVLDEELEDDGSVIDIASLKASVLKEIGLRVFEPETRFVLKMKFTGAEYLHRTMGTPYGLPYGKIYELSGAECLADDTFVRFTVLNRKGERVNSKGGTIKRLYERFHGLEVPGRGKYQRKQLKHATYTLASVNEQGRIISNQIENVVKSGRKKCYQLTTESGYRIVTSADHRFFNGKRYVRLEKLSVGDTVMIHNNTPYKVDHGRLIRPYVDVLVHNHPSAPDKITVEPSSGKVYTYKRLKRSRAVVEAKMNGMVLTDYVELLNSGDIAGLQFLSSDQHVHHIDEDTMNDEPDNLEVKTPSEHGVLHATERHNNLRFVIVPDVIASITCVGERDTYDISMRVPFNNFVANNFVVHNSHGKSVLQKLIEGEAQKDGAVVIHGDIEDSDDPPWNVKLGVDNDQLILVKPKMIILSMPQAHKDANKVAKEAWTAKPAAWKLEHPYKRPFDPPLRPQTAEEIFEEIEKLVEKLHAAGVEKMVVAIDSLANLSTKMQLEAGTHTNMRTNSDFPMFLSQNLKRWQTLASNFNIMVLLINQIREKPGVMFGDPIYEPGGRALRHNCASRNRARRAGNGKIFLAGKLIGISGILKNTKNKSGEGSMEQQMCTYMVEWNDKPLYKRVSFGHFVAKEKPDKNAPVDAD